MIPIDLDKAVDDIQRICRFAMDEPSLWEEGIDLERALFEAHDAIMLGMANAIKVRNGGKLTPEIDAGFDKLEIVRRRAMLLSEQFLRARWSE
jgi:hypothetical protein